MDQNIYDKLKFECYKLIIQIKLNYSYLSSLD